MEHAREPTEPVGLRLPKSMIDEIRSLTTERGEFQDRTTANAIVRLLRKALAAERSPQAA